MVLNNLQAICLLAQLLTKIGFKIDKSKNSELKQLCILFEGELKNGTKKIWKGIFQLISIFMKKIGYKYI